MEAIMEVIRYFIHNNRDELARVEAEFTIATKPLYHTAVFGLICLIVLFLIGLYINVEANHLKKWNLVIIFIAIPFITLHLLHARNIFKVALAGTTYGIAKSDVSGLEGGTTLLKQYISSGLYLMVGIICIFGTLSLINFSWTSAVFGIVFGSIVFFTTIAKKLTGD